MNTVSTVSVKRNFIGRIIGFNRLATDGSKIEIYDKGEKVQELDFSNSLVFFQHKNGLLGNSYKFEVLGKSRELKYFKSNSSSELLNLVNRKIKNRVNAFINLAYSDFSELVYQHYPRDSQLVLIEEIVKDVATNYSKQKALWKQYLGNDDIHRVELLAQFYPLNPEKLRAHHEAYQLKQRQDFFDNVESNPLTQDQRLGVLRSNDRNMVLAAAGTGKTSVMVAKSLDIIQRGLALPSEILVLAYNKAAADELKERLIEKADKSNITLESAPQISTFHALGRDILREAKVPTNISIFAEDPFRLEQWVTQWIHSYIALEPTRVFDFIELSTTPVDPFDFKSKGEYENYLRDNEFRTLNNEKVKSYQELLIANFFFMNNISYQYEVAYVAKRRIDIGFDYKPDFYITEYGIYLEHFGIDRKGNTRPDIDSETYAKSIESKRKLHQEYGTTLVESYHYEWKENTLFSQLKSKLITLGVEFEPLHPNEIFTKINQHKKMSSWSKMMTKSLQAIRTERLNEEGIKERLQQAGINQAEKYTNLLSTLHSAYIEELAFQNTIDFDDMIIRANQVVTKNVFKPTWKYILVDEFQDISSARMEFINSIIKLGPQPSLTVVGDDWQSIYRFSGGKLELTTRFSELVGNHTKTKLQKTFRYNKGIADTAGMFIQENPEQCEKNVETQSQENETVYLLDNKPNKEGGEFERVLEVIRKIRDNDHNGSIAVIARYNYLLDEAKSKVWSKGFKDNLSFWSFHKSKGLEADYCILIGFFQGKKGFPNENKDDAIVEALLPSLDNFPHSEERRLFYVGITRAKKKSYIIANPFAPSDFITELLAPKYSIHIASDKFEKQFREIFKCPKCDSGYFRRLTGKFGDFYRCSTDVGCHGGKAKICDKCSSPFVNYLSKSKCNNLSCGYSIKTCKICGRSMKKRNGKYGEFWGCAGYGLKEDKCSYTEQ